MTMLGDLAVEPQDLSDGDSDEYSESNTRRTTRPKRRKVNNGRSRTSVDNKPCLSFRPLLDLIESNDEEGTFESLVEVLLPEYIQDRVKLQEKEFEWDEYGNSVRPMTRHERLSFIRTSRASKQPASLEETIVLRKLKLQAEKRSAGLPEVTYSALQAPSLTPLPQSRPAPSINPEVLGALYSIQTTPYENSFLSRLCGTPSEKMTGLVALDWETQAPWMDLMRDVRAHYSVAHPERSHVEDIVAPIAYVSLQACHLDQVHDLLARVFWTGINVSDSLQDSPERCTIVATYKKLVVGAAFLSSPQEAYITYLAVRAGWDNAQIATNMLFHLIALNPKKDITLHVSANNPAMLLYNRFGFKAEEFIAGFYEDYLDPQSRGSKNAFRLRLRR